MTKYTHCCEWGNTYVLRYEDVNQWYINFGRVYIEATFCPFCGQRLGDVPSPLLTLPKRLCFDVDGVIADDRDGKPYGDRVPYPHAVQYLRKLKAAGHEIVLATARYMIKRDGDQEAARGAGYWELLEWLDRYEVPYDEVYLGKPSADKYYDDKAGILRSIAGTIDWEAAFGPLQ